MMVEFIGCTGAGKTTVAAAVQRALAGLAPVDEAPDWMASLLGLPRPPGPFQRNLVCDLIGLPFFLGSLPRYWAFLSFNLATLARQRPSLQVANRVRSTVRKIGVYEIIRRHGNGRIVLVDEGTVLNAHNLFVFTSRAYTAADLERFAKLVPLPHLLVYVRAPLATLMRRSLERPDPPREIRSRDRALVERSVSRAFAVFEALVAIPSIHARVVVVENPGGSVVPSEPAVGPVVAAIRELSGQELDAVP